MRFSISGSRPLNVGLRRTFHSPAVGRRRYQGHCGGAARVLFHPRLPLASLLRPLAVDSAIQGQFGAESLDENDALVGVDADLMAKAISKCPDDEIAVARVLECMRLSIARQVADTVARPDRKALVSVM